MRLRIRVLATRCARGLRIFRTLENRGRRESRVRAAPAVSCAMCTKRCAHEHTGPAEASRLSLRDGFTAYTALSPVTGFLATVIPEKLASHELDTSIGVSGPHDFAVRIGAVRLSCTAASTASHRAFRDDREPPLLSGETGGFKSLICPTAKAEYFYLRSWTDFW
jgi:hypothetical protein